MRRYFSIRCLLPRAPWLLASILSGHVAGQAFSQTRPPEVRRAEVFVGASGLRSFRPFGGEGNLVGWQGAVDFNIFKPVGFVLDFGGQYRGRLRPGRGTESFYEYMAGPRIKYRIGRATPFLETLLGGLGDRIPNGGVGGIAAAVGVGLDVNVGPRVAVRAFQIDWIPTKIHGTWDHTGRLGFGVVVKLGRTLR